MSKKKRNVFNLPEALYRGILEDVHNDPDLYINPDPTVREDIHYIAYTLYAQRPSDRDLSRNYIIALGEMGKLCDEIERRTGKPVERKVIDAAKAQVEKDKKARHAKEAEAHKDDKDYFGNPKPYVHKYWKYEEETEDTLALIELLKAYYSGKASSSDDDEEEVVELTKRNKHGKNKKNAPEPIVELDEDDDEDEEDSDEDDDFNEEDDEDDDTQEITIGGFKYDRNHNYRAELADALDDDDEDEEDSDEDDDDEEDEDDDDSIPVLRTPNFLKRPVTPPASIPKEEPADPFAGFECEADDDDDTDLDSVDLESEQAAFDAWVAKQNTDEAVVNMGSLAVSSDSHRLADSDDELSDDDDEEEEEEEIPDDPYAKVRHLIPDGVEPDDYHRKVLRTILQATSCWPDRPEKVDIMPLDELFQYYSLKNPEATIKQFKKLPAYAPYLDKYLPGWNEKADAEAPKKDNAPVVKESAPVEKPVEKVKAEIVEETPIAKPDPNKPMTFAEFDAYAKSMVKQAKDQAAQHASDYYKFRAEHPWPTKKSSEVKSEIVEEKPEEPKPEELEKDEITFAGDRLTPEEANAIMDASFGGNEPEEVEEPESDNDDDSDDDAVPYYQIYAALDTDGDCDHIFKIGDGLNIVSINLDYLDDSDPDASDSDNLIANAMLVENVRNIYSWFVGTIIHFRPSVILTQTEYDAMMRGIDAYDDMGYVFYKLGPTYVAGYNVDDDFGTVITDLVYYLRDNNKLTAFFKRYIKIVSDLDGFSFLNTNTSRFGWLFQTIVDSPMNSKEMKDAFISDFREGLVFDENSNGILYPFSDVESSSVVGNESDEAYYNSVFMLTDAMIKGVDTSTDGDEEEPDDSEAAVVDVEPEKVREVHDTPKVMDVNPNQEMVNAANTLFTLTADKKVDLDDVGMVARKLQDFVNKEVAEARGKLNPEELVEDNSDDEVEDDDDIEEEYFPNRRKEVKKTSNPVKKPVQKKNNNDDDPNAFVIQRR